MATTPSATHETCTLRAEAPVFVPGKASAESTGFKLNPAAAEYKQSKGQQALGQLCSILTDTCISETCISERGKHSDGSAKSSGQCSEGPDSAASSPGRTYAASSSSESLVDDATGSVVVIGNEGSSRESSPRRQGVLHHHHIHHHIHHNPHAGHPKHVNHISSGYMHVQPHGAIRHVPYRPYPAPGNFPAIPPGTPVPNYRPIPCEAYLLNHPLRDVRTGYWEVPAAQPIRHRYSAEDLALFRSTHKEWKVANGIPLYANTNGNNKSQRPRCSQQVRMAREYHAQNTYEYRDLESIEKVCGRAEGLWYGWY